MVFGPHYLLLLQWSFPIFMLVIKWKQVLSHCPECWFLALLAGEPSVIAITKPLDRFTDHSWNTLSFFINAAFDGIWYVTVLVLANFVFQQMWSYCLALLQSFYHNCLRQHPCQHVLNMAMPKCLSPCCYLCETPKSSVFIFTIFFSELTDYSFLTSLCIRLLNLSLYISLHSTITCFFSMNDFKFCFFVITQCLKAECASDAAVYDAFLTCDVTFLSMQLSNTICVATCWKLLNKLCCVLTPRSCWRYL